MLAYIILKKMVAKWRIIEVVEDNLKIRSCHLKIHHAFDSNENFVSFVDFKAYAMLNKMFVDNLFVVMKSFV